LKEITVENLIPTVKSVSELISDFQTGRIAIPEIQRDVVWTSEQIKDLIDSISRGYPCGALIFWEPREKDEKLVKSMIRPERLELYDGTLPATSCSTANSGSPRLPRSCSRAMRSRRSCLSLRRTCPTSSPT
jgi:hypothetical protein